MFKYLAVSVLLPLLATAIQFRSCSEGASPLTVEIEGCTAFPCRMVRGDFIVSSASFTNTRNTSSLTTNVNFRSVVGSGTYLLTEDQVNACDNLISGSCPLSVGANYTHRLNLFITESLFPGFDITLEILLRDAQNSVLVCYEADFIVI